MLLCLKFIISCLQETLISYKGIMSCQTGNFMYKDFAILSVRSVDISKNFSSGL